MDVTVRRSHIEPLGSGLRRSYQAAPAGRRSWQLHAAMEETTRGSKMSCKMDQIKECHTLTCAYNYYEHT